MAQVPIGRATMRYSDQMQASGSWLFRWRSYLPLVFVLILLASLHRFRFLGGSEADDELWELVCLGVSLFGLVLRCLTVGFTPDHTSGRNARAQVAEELNTTGMYSMVRHPLYLANLVIWIGIALYPHDWLVVALCMGVFWLYYERIILAEEAFLAAKFGEQFGRWAAVTPAFVPSPRLFRPPANRFSVRKVLKREYPAFSGIIFTMFMLELAGDYEVEGHFDLDTLWVVLLALGVGVHVLLRGMKKHTRLLHDDSL